VPSNNYCIGSRVACNIYSSGTGNLLALHWVVDGCCKLTLNLARLDVVGDALGGAAIDLATSGEGGADNLKDGTLERLGHGLVAHGAGNLNDLVKRDRLGVLDVLLLFAVTRGLLERLDDKGGGRRNDRDGGLTVLDGQADGDAETLPVASGLGDIFTDLLGRKTERTDLGRKSGRGTDLTSGGTEVNDLLLVGIELGSFAISYQHGRIDAETSEPQSELRSHGSKR
jgi:hypothetical protein